MCLLSSLGPTSLDLPLDNTPFSKHGFVEHRSRSVGCFSSGSITGDFLFSDANPNSVPPNRTVNMDPMMSNYRVQPTSTYSYQPQQQQQSSSNVRSIVCWVNESWSFFVDWRLLNFLMVFQWIWWITAISFLRMSLSRRWTTIFCHRRIHRIWTTIRWWCILNRRLSIFNIIQCRIKDPRITFVQHLKANRQTCITTMLHHLRIKWLLVIIQCSSSSSSEHHRPIILLRWVNGPHWCIRPEQLSRRISNFSCICPWM